MYIIFKGVLYSDSVVAYLKNALSLSLIKKKFQISENQNKDQRKDGWYRAIAILTMQTHTPSFFPGIKYLKSFSMT